LGGAIAIYCTYPVLAQSGSGDANRLISPMPMAVSGGGSRLPSFSSGSVVTADKEDMVVGLETGTPDR
jgi:hypothetical protein